MSTEAHVNHGSHAGHDRDGGVHATLGGYLIGFGLSAVLTAIPFWLVMSGVLGNKEATVVAVMAFAAVQIVVHMIFFLHMSPRSEDGWTMMALIFTLVMVLITLAGSLWVMYHLNTNMMPSHDMSRLP
ncbi:cytochrome o ubiquinol oxidase subunit IV [Hyphomicrobium sp.]|jgi:cytochrome o ubiquinol oxidase operon protein cyoD|uniref:cytochrome o ubiquinol oxidase subunit IV n=1 Tax=Hyphomicrobium sp. TaxID=82 RepID=UPI002C85BC4F|nr:cytochrome o ubiquinol oxidase subunit IV [Hyphomicrobium sp.]HVZ03111.1 cytochrome o ubiquinol oxidase subunit IV [Hyphomicrobium sp.]